MDRLGREVGRQGLAPMMVPQAPLRGQVFWVRLPGHPRDAKVRPALVVSIDVRNRLANDVLVVPLTTTLRPAPTHVWIPAGEGGLPQDSMAKCEQITTLDKSFLSRGPLGGMIRLALLREVEKAVLRSIGVPVF